MTTLAAASASIDSLRSLRAFVAIELRRTLRNRRYVMFAIAFPVVFYLLYTGILSGASADPTALVGGIQWRTYFMVSMASYAAIVAALSGAVVIARERQSGWTRQLRVTPLPPMAYVVGKLLISFIVTIPAIAAVMVAGLVVNHVELSAGRWLELLVVLVAASLPFAALGLLIGYLFDADSAQGAMLVSFFSLAIIGGLWAPISSFPDTLASIGRVLPSFRIADLGRSVVEGAAIDPADVALLIVYAALFGALVAWRYRTSEQRASG